MNLDSEDNYITTLQHEIKDLEERNSKLRDVALAAKFLRDSGYDGPFMGEMVAPLFRALAALEQDKHGKRKHP